MTDVLAVEQLNASDFDTAVVAIGDSVEASVITAGNLLDAGISDIWAKSVSKEHAHPAAHRSASHHQRRNGMQASASGIWCPETIWITSRSRARTPSSRSTRLRTWSAIPSRTRRSTNATASPSSASRRPAASSSTVPSELVMHRNDELVIMGKQDNIDKFIRG